MIANALMPVSPKNAIRVRFMQSVVTGVENCAIASGSPRKRIFRNSFIRGENLRMRRLPFPNRKCVSAISAPAVWKRPVATAAPITPICRGEHKQPVEKDIQRRADDVGNGDQSGGAVVAAERLQIQGKRIRDREKRIPAHIFPHQRQIAFRRPEQTAHRARAYGTRQRDQDARKQVQGQRVHKGTLRALLVAAAKADGRDGHAADARHRVQRLREQDEGQRQIDGAERLTSRAVADKNAVHDGE